MAFDRYMIRYSAGTHPKFATFTDGERCAHFLGVLPIAAQSPVRGCLLVGDLPAEAAHVAAVAGVSRKTAASAMKKAQAGGMLEHDADRGCLRVHDWDDHNPAPKQDRTNAERQKRFRDRQSNAVTNAVTNGSVTPPEVKKLKLEVEGEEEVVAAVYADASASASQEAHRSGAQADDINNLFLHWADKCRHGSRDVVLTQRRDVAVRSRYSKDNFTIEELREAIDGAGEAIEREQLDYDHHLTEFYGLFVDREHTQAWIDYHRTGDIGPVYDVHATAQPKVAA